MQFSDYQKAIFEFIASDTGHAFVSARAGSGKTTTLVEAAKRAVGRKLFVAFNKSIATELDRRLSGAAMACTAHSFGYRAIRAAHPRCRVDGRKYRDLIKSASVSVFSELTLDDEALAQARRHEHIRPLQKILEMLRLNCEPVSRVTVTRMQWKYNAMLPEWLNARAAARIIGMALAAGRRSLRKVDFVDMVCLPTELNMACDEFDFVFVDEAQDLSPALLALVRRAIAPGGRAVFVGDPAQAIYGFAGADVDSVDTIVRELDCKVLPLSICYRCPASVIDEARKIVPDIEARDGAADGTVRSMAASKIGDEVRDGDLILARVNAPLVALCFSLLADGHSATIRGRDIGAGIKRIAERAIKVAGAWIDIMAGLSHIEAQDRRKLVKRDADDDAFQSLDDRYGCVRVLLAASQADSLDDFKAHVDALFADDRAQITLSSIHRAKGLEADRVFVHPRKLAGATVAADIEDGNARQEANLRYVAVTRAQSELIFLTE